VLAVLLVLLAKAATLTMPFAYKAAIDRMAPGNEPAVMLAVALVVAYAGARFGAVLFDNARNAIFELVGQDAGRRLAVDVFRHLHALSLRYHLERRTGALTKIVERGTKSIDTMLYFILFNIAPTVIELSAVCIIFLVKFGWELVAATILMVSLYIWYTRIVTDWRTKMPSRARWIRCSITRPSNISTPRIARRSAMAARSPPMRGRRPRTRLRSPSSTSASRSSPI
jgi:ATP-binding cassette subfamily B protein